MDFLDSFTDTEPTTSRVNLSNQAIHSVNLTNLTLNGAKVFDNPADKTRFMSEFGQLQIQHPNWSPVRLIRERLQIQMKIHDENSMERRRQKKKATTNNTSKAKRNQKDESDSEQEDEEEPEFHTLNDRLINSINEQIENSRFIELRESKTVCAQADNVLVIDAGDGKCVILNCQELLEMNRDNLQSIDDIRWLDSDQVNAVNGQEMNGTNVRSRLKRNRSTNNHLDPNPVFTRSGRIKHSCLHCHRMFTNTDSFMEHMKENHIFEELDEELDIKPDPEFLSSLTKNDRVS